MEINNKQNNNVSRSLPHTSWHSIGHNARADWMLILIACTAMVSIFAVIGISRYFDIQKRLVDQSGSITAKKTLISNERLERFLEIIAIREQNRKSLSDKTIRGITDPSL